MALQFKRDKYSGYWAYGERYGYQVIRDGKTWLINVREVVETAGIRHTVGQPIIWHYQERVDTLALGKAVVQYFDADPRHEMFEAISKAYAEERERWINRE